MISSIGTSIISQFLPRAEKAAAPLANELNPGTLVGTSDAPLGLGNARPTAASPHSSFSNFIDRAVQEVDGKMKTAAADQAKVMTGETNNLHQAMISMQEASVAFSLMVEVRNKLVDSYQELMRMQV